MDALLLGFIAGFVWGGYRSGFVRRLAGLGFIALSFVLGAYIRQPLGAWIGTTFDVPESYGELVAYIFIFPAVLILAHVITNPILKNVAVSGLTRQADQLLGAVFGGIEAVLILSVMVVIFDTYYSQFVVVPDVGLGYLTSFAEAFNSSTTVRLLRESTVPLVLTILGPFLPSDVSSLVPTSVPGLPTVPGFPSNFPGLPTPSPTKSH